MCTDPDQTPIFFGRLSSPEESMTPTAPSLRQVTWVRPAVGRSWDPPPLRELIQSAPPPPRPPLRSQLEIDCGLFVARDGGAFEWFTTPVEEHPVVPMRTLPVKRIAAAFSLLAIGAVATFIGVTDTSRFVVSDVAEAPALSKSKPAEVATKAKPAKALRLVGYVTDPPRKIEAAEEMTSSSATLDAIDLATLRVVVGMAAARAGAACRSQNVRTTRVNITIAPSGRTSHVAVHGPLGATPTASCIGHIMRQVQVPRFEGLPTTVTKRIVLSERIDR